MSLMHKFNGEVKQEMQPIPNQTLYIEHKHDTQTDTRASARTLSRSYMHTHKLCKSTCTCKTYQKHKNMGDKASTALKRLMTKQIRWV